MKKYILPIVLMAAIVALTITVTFGQKTMAKITPLDTVIGNYNHKFVLVEMMRINLRDSVTGGVTTTTGSPTTTTVTPTVPTNYYSLKESTVTYKVKQMMWKNNAGVGDTIVRYVTATIPMLEVRATVDNLLTSNKFRKSYITSLQNMYMIKPKDLKVN